VHATLQLARTVRRGHAWRLRKLTHADEVLRVQRTYPRDQIVAHLGPGKAYRFVADMVRHGRGTGGKDGHVGAALALELELRALEAVADGVVRNRGRRDMTLLALLDLRELGVPEVLQGLGRRRVVAVAVDDHRLCLVRGA